MGDKKKIKLESLIYRDFSVSGLDLIILSPGGKVSPFIK